MQSKIGQILVEDLIIDNWRSKVTPKIKQLAKILIKTDGQSFKPPIVERIGKGDRYQLSIKKGKANHSINEIAIAAKVAENEGLERLTVLIPAVDPALIEEDQDLTSELLQMEALLKTPTKEVKQTSKPKRQAPTTTDKKPESAKVKKPKTEAANLVVSSTEKPTKEKSYREIQLKLKGYRDEGMKLNCKLNVKKAILQIELNRVNALRTGGSCWPS